MFSSTAHSVLIDRGLVTYDTTTQLEWLDLSQTQGMSIFDVWVDSSIQNADWVLATRTQINVLLTSYVGATSGTFLPGSSVNTNIANLVSLFGSFSAGPGYFTSAGYYRDGGDPNMFGIGVLDANTTGSQIRLLDNRVGSNISGTGTGTFLVRVPEPETYLLMLVAILLIWTSVRRQRQGARKDKLLKFSSLRSWDRPDH